MFNIFSKLLEKDLAIDLGTANTLVYTKRDGILLQGPSVVAMRNSTSKTGEILAVGNEAKKMIGRTPDNIIAVRPMKDGVIADFNMAAKMLKYFITEAYRRNKLLKPRIIISVPSGVTKVEKKAVIDVALYCRAKGVYLIEEPIAAAIGAGLPINEASGNMVVDIGGGTTDIAIISLGGMVTSNSIRVAGDEMNEAIIGYLKNKYNLLIGENKAEEIKIQYGAATFPKNSKLKEDLTFGIRGRDYVSGLAKTVEVSCGEIQEVLQKTIDKILEAIKITLERTPAELSGDIIDNGIIMAGGGALLTGLDRFLSKNLGVPVYLDENPLNCIVLGAGKVLEDLDQFKNFLVSDRS